MSQTSLSTAGEVAMHMNAEVEMGRHSSGLFARSLVIGLTAFLTVVDLFATQAILPSLARHYSVTPGAMGFAVNASTLGMAIAGLGVAYFSQANRSQARHPDRVGRARHPDGAARERAEPHGLYYAARRAGTLHGLRLHADARLSRRAHQSRRYRERVCRLHHRQCCEQSDRPA